jgi:hypothetical protein
MDLRSKIDLPPIKQPADGRCFDRFALFSVTSVGPGGGRLPTVHANSLG